MILVTVFKDRERYESDLRKSYRTLCGSEAGLSENSVWSLAKELTSKVDFTQKVHVTDAFYSGKKPGEVKDDIFAIGHSIAQGRRFKVSTAYYIN